MSTNEQRPGRGRRVGLTREGIIDAAIVLIESDGMDAFSLRRLAAELGVDPMSLYNHVGNKDDLFDGVVEAVFEDVGEAIGEWSGPWQEQVRRGCVAFRSVLLTRPEVSVLVLTRRASSDVPLRALRGAMNPGLAAGMSPQESIRMLRVVTAFLTGSVLRELGSTLTFTTGGGARSGPPEARLPDADDPVLAELGDTVAVIDHDAIFVYGVELLIAGIASQLRSQNTSEIS